MSNINFKGNLPYPNSIDTPVSFDHIYPGPAYNPIYININRVTFKSTNKNNYIFQHLPTKGVNYFLHKNEIH
jgi:hypothetical protein